MKIMTLEDATYFYDQDLTTMIDEMYWEGGCNTEKLFDRILKWAADDGITIIDANTVDYDAVLHALYQDTEKGLS